MIGDIEEHFQIEMDISDLLEITTVGDALNYIEHYAVSQKTNASAAYE